MEAMLITLPFFYYKVIFPLMFAPVVSLFPVKSSPSLSRFDLLVRVHLLHFLQLPVWSEDAPDLFQQSGRHMGQEAWLLFQPLLPFILDGLQR